MSDVEYFASEGLNNSFLIQFDRSPAHAYIPKVETEQMKTGKLLHTFILEPDIFKMQYVIAPSEIPHDKRTNSYKEFVKQQSKDVLFESDSEILQKILKNIYRYRFEGMPLEKYLVKSEKEISLFWDISINERSLQCKAKLDALYIDKNKAIIFDIKKTQSCLEFQKSVNTYRYYRQANYYLSGLKQLKPELESVRFIFIVIEDQEPYGVMSYELDQAYLDAGAKETFKSILKYVAWNGDKTELYENRTVLLSKPNWMLTD